MRKAREQIRKYERKFGDLSQYLGSTLPAYRQPPGTLNLKQRLLIHLPRGMPVAECWVCGRPYIPEGTKVPCCSESCQKKRRNYFKHLENSYYRNPRAQLRTPPDVMAYIKQEKRLQFCAVCDNPFVPTSPVRKYCGKPCRQEASRKRKAQRLAHNRKTAAYARRRNAEFRELRIKPCLICGTIFEAKSSRQIYCTRACHKQLLKDKKSPPPIYRRCVGCDKSFLVSRRHKGAHWYCSPNCMEKMWARASHREAMGIVRPCMMCGMKFRPEQKARGRRIFCTSVCCQRHLLIRKLGFQDYFKKIAA